ncbi:MAG: choice-of-anchor O protein [Sulfurovum sp.]|nr:choice-of-anchor O protein [Sulfurovum sp.]
MKMTLLSGVLISAAASMVIVGCGGGSSGTTDVASQGIFIDSEVQGLDYDAQPSRLRGQTDADGHYDFVAGDTVKFSLGCIELGYIQGSTQAVSPVDFFEDATSSDTRVVNIARTLQSLDTDGQAGNGITITSEAISLLEQEVGCDADLSTYTTENLTAALTAVVEDTNVTEDRVISEEVAVNHLDASLSGDTVMFRKNISKTPEMESSKPKLNTMTIYVDAQKADGTPVYTDETNTTRLRVHPLVSTYADSVEDADVIWDGETRARDIFAAVSLDDGATWKRINLSRTAKRSSFKVKVRDESGNDVLDENGTAVTRDYPGDSHKAAMSTSGNNILVVWDDKFCRSGNPMDLTAYDAETNQTIPADENMSDYNVTYPDDKYLVNGPQGSVDYAEILVNGEYPFAYVGEVPYSCVMASRIVINPEAEDPTQVIVPYVAEQITTGRRDALQLFSAAATNGDGFGFTWQEDPEGLRPGSGKGPGAGWGGATTNHKTDIWYTYIHMTDFATPDTEYISSGDQDQNSTAAEDDENDTVTTRPHALVNFALPVRISNNDVCKIDTVLEGKGAKYCEYMCETYGWLGDAAHPADANDTAYGKCYGPGIDPISEEQFLLDGDTGASRPNIFIQYDTVQKKSVAVFGYEETKGLGDGAPEDQGVPQEGTPEDVNWTDTGKYVIYESFPFDNPESLTDAEGYVISGGNILNEKNSEGIYENARRIRFVAQGMASMATSVNDTVLVALYKEGMEGQGRPSDIMLKTFTGGYAISKANPAINISSVTPTELNITEGDSNSTDEDNLKVVAWDCNESNLQDDSFTNPYDDARAHRGVIRGDFIAIGYTYTPNWAAARQAHDNYDFYIRRSFDGGETWTDANGTFEGPVNMSNLPNNKETVIEPRLVGTPGTIKTDGVVVDPKDQQNQSVYFACYGTAENVPQVIGSLDPDDVVEGGAPIDLFYTRTTDKGETYELVTKTISVDSDGNNAGDTVTQMDWLAHSNAEEGEVQLRMTPDGSVFYSSWIQDLDLNDTTTPDHFKGSDIWFRKIDYNIDINETE